MSTGHPSHPSEGKCRSQNVKPLTKPKKYKNDELPAKKTSKKQHAGTQQSKPGPSAQLGSNPPPPWVPGTGPRGISPIKTRQRPPHGRVGGDRRPRPHDQSPRPALAHGKPRPTHTREERERAVSGEEKARERDRAGARERRAVGFAITLKFCASACAVPVDRVAAVGTVPRGRLAVCNFAFAVTTSCAA